MNQWYIYIPKKIKGLEFIDARTTSIQGASQDLQVLKKTSNKMVLHTNAWQLQLNE